MSQHLEHELDKLRKKLLELFAEVNDMVKKSVDAFEALDITLAQEVITRDFKIDQQEVDVEEECLKILALHQPVAIDLRYIVGALKMNNDLERIADLAVNICERAIYLKQLNKVESPFRFDIMGALVERMLERAIKSLIERNKEMAAQVIVDDDEVDSINRDMYQKVFAAVKNDSVNVASYIQYLSVSRNLERIADYTTNIAEDMIYMVDGVIIRHKEHKFK